MFVSLQQRSKLFERSSSELKKNTEGMACVCVCVTQRVSTDDLQAVHCDCRGSLMVYFETLDANLWSCLSSAKLL
jgi:hypothetical protein